MGNLMDAARVTLDPHKILHPADPKGTVFSAAHELSLTQTTFLATNQVLQNIKEMKSFLPLYQITMQEIQKSTSKMTETIHMHGDYTTLSWKASEWPKETRGILTNPWSARKGKQSLPGSWRDGQDRGKFMPEGLRLKKKWGRSQINKPRLQSKVS